MLLSAPKVVSFQEQQVDRGQFLIVAVPFGYKEHRLDKSGLFAQTCVWQRFFFLYLTLIFSYDGSVS